MFTWISIQTYYLIVSIKKAQKQRQLINNDHFQILLSKYNSPIKGARVPWKKRQILGLGKYQVNLQYLVLTENKD